MFSHHIWQLVIGSLFVGSSATIVSTVVCGRLVSAFFDRGLGTALGFMTSGIGISAVLGPSIMQRVVDGHGWQMGFYGMAGAALIVTPILWLLTRRTTAARSRPMAPVGHGLSLKEAVRTQAFWLMGAAILVYGVCISGATVNMMVFLTGEGISRVAAAGLMGAYGMFTIAGRLGTGMILDRIPFHIGKLMALFRLLMGRSYLIIGHSPLMGGIAIGLSIFGFLGGSESDCMAYGTVRVFGRRAFGAIYGTLGMGFYHVGIGLGPMAFSATSDALKSYPATFSIWAAMILLAGVLFYLISRTPYTQAVQGEPAH